MRPVPMLLSVGAWTWVVQGVVRLYPGVACRSDAACGRVVDGVSLHGNRCAACDGAMVVQFACRVYAECAVGRPCAACRMGGLLQQADVHVPARFDPACSGKQACGA